jgi:hypothetical protein
MESVPGAVGNGADFSLWSSDSNHRLKSVPLPTARGSVTSSPSHVRYASCKFANCIGTDPEDDLRHRLLDRAID